MCDDRGMLAKVLIRCDAGIVCGGLGVLTFRAPRGPALHTRSAHTEKHSPHTHLTLVHSPLSPAPQHAHPNPCGQDKWGPGGRPHPEVSTLLGLLACGQLPTASGGSWWAGHVLSQLRAPEHHSSAGDRHRGSGRHLTLASHSCQGSAPKPSRSRALPPPTPSARNHTQLRGGDQRLHLCPRSH